jgi:hypothetical protein
MPRRAVMAKAIKARAHATMHQQNDANPRQAAGWAGGGRQALCLVGGGQAWALCLAGAWGCTGRPCAYAAVARRSSRSLAACPFRSARWSRMAGKACQGLLGPALACLGLWAGGRLGLAVSGHVTGSKGSRSCITDLKKSERKGKVP